MSDNTAAEARQSTPSRRAMLCGTAGIGGAAALALCGCSSSVADGSASDAPASDAPTSTGAADSPSPGSAAANGTADPSMSGGPTVLGRAMDVPVGGGVVFPAAKVVVTQATAGQYKAFSAVCTHKGCTVSGVSGGVITCPCHGSTFKIADGSVAGGPAMSALPAVAVKVDGGNLVLGG